MNPTSYQMLTNGNAILKVLSYFDIFHYPLSVEEIICFLNDKTDKYAVTATLEELLEERRIFKHDDFYSLQNDRSLIVKRKSGNERAQALLKTAIKISSFLFQFPYVRGIGISGSLSKNVANENADIDFFIITKSNRLWIARTMMHLFKKFTFLVGKQHWFCMNYFVDEQALKIQEQNVFTATEVMTLLPVCGNGTLKKFFDANEWAQIYFPNYQLCTDSLKKAKSSVIKKFLEAVFDNKFGEKLDDYLMKKTSSRWLKKEQLQKRNIKGNLMGLRAGKHFSKPNPEFFQQKVLMLYETKLREIHKKAEPVMV